MSSHHGISRKIWPSIVIKIHTHGVKLHHRPIALARRRMTKVGLLAKTVLILRLLYEAWALKHMG